MGGRATLTSLDWQTKAALEHLVAALTFASNVVKSMKKQRSEATTATT